MSHRLPRLWLASASPRRRALLAQVGIEAEVRPVPVDESRLAGETPEACVQRLARCKAEALWDCLDEFARRESVVLGADTVVVLDGQVLGKPADEKDALAMLAALSGRWHTVLTAVSVLSACGQSQCCVATHVKMRTIPASEALAYWRTGEPADKAGAYGIQGLAALFIESIRGSYPAVVGLPLAETARLLAGHGIVAGWQENRGGH